MTGGNIQEVVILWVVEVSKSTQSFCIYYGETVLLRYTASLEHAHYNQAIAEFCKSVNNLRELYNYKMTST